MEKKFIYEQEKYSCLKPENLNKNELKVLFIGNSYTNYNSLMICFKNMAIKEGYKVSVTKVAYGSQYLHDYVDCEEGDYFYSLKETVENKKFDIAFIQGQSREPIENPSDFYSSARQLVSYLSNFNIPSIFYQTWGYPVGYKSIMEGIGCFDTFDMAKKMAARYEDIASELDVEVSNAGTAMLYLFDKYKDSNTALVYANDANSHPSSIGTYLVALCHFCKIFSFNPKGIKYKYNDYANDDEITWHVEKIDSISDELQSDIEEAVFEALNGPSIVTDEYKIK